MNDRTRHLTIDGHLRPLDRFGSIKVKLGVLVAVAVTSATFLTWLGLRSQLGPSRIFPLVVGASLLVTQILAHGMTMPLRQMLAAVTSMAEGDYSTRVTATSRDEVGALASAFNQMATDLGNEDAARRALVANVSHELRTPVAALRVQLENLADGVVDATPDELAKALARTEQLSELVAYLLDLSRLEAGATSLDRERIVLRPFLDDVLETAQCAALTRGRALQWSCSVQPEDLSIEGDVSRLRQVLINLFDNAARHAPKDSTVTVRATRAPRRKGVIIDVIDSGSGIRESERARVFNRFERGADADLAGTGLGLSISKWAVGLHGGTISVLDTPRGTSSSSDPSQGVGTTIRIHLPGEKTQPMTPVTGESLHSP